MYQRFLMICILSITTVTGKMTASVDQRIHQAEQLIYAENFTTAEDILKPLVQAGHGEALFFLSHIQLFGSQKNIPEGLKNMHLAVEKHNLKALDTFAGFYLHGEFVPQNKEKALVYYQKAASLGYGPSQFNCGILYRNGDGVPRNLETAYVYLALAAINKKDLDDVTQDAARYRDEVSQQLTPAQRTQAAIRIHHLTSE